jgi:hypothetical protein
MTDQEKANLQGIVHIVRCELLASQRAMAQQLARFFNALLLCGIVPGENAELFADIVMPPGLPVAGPDDNLIEVILDDDKLLEFWEKCLRGYLRYQIQKETQALHEKINRRDPGLMASIGVAPEWVGPRLVVDRENAGVTRIADKAISARTEQVGR